MSDAEPAKTGVNEVTASMDDLKIHEAKSSIQRKTGSHPLENLDSEITFKDAAKEQAKTLDEMWKVVAKSSSSKSIPVKPTTERKGWKTIRLFVSSTFRDFHQEREVLVKQVFPDLRLWCESRKLRLVECDLRWGVPKDTKAEDTIRICLSELDRCYEDNTAPFFLNLTGDRAGWIPQFEDMSANLAAQYGWIYGLSVTEMEIVHGSMRKLNPNALFMIRTAAGADDMPDELKTRVFEQDHQLKEKLTKLKSVIREMFSETHVKPYTVQCRHEKCKQRIDFDGLDHFESEFCTTIFDFFKQRIDELYPLDPSPSDPLQIQKIEHETFLLSRSSCVLGRDTIISAIEDYVIQGSPSNAPLVVVGVAGAGKSALMAKCAHNAAELVEEGNIRFANNVSCKREVFFHFVGATPRSTDLASFLQRLTKELKPDMTEVPTNLDSLINLAYNLLQNPTTEPMVVFLDALNQMDEETQKYLSRWLPEKLSPNIRVVVSTIEGTSSQQTLRMFKSNPKEIVCGPLDETSREAIVTNILRIYNKQLADDQMKLLLSKEGSKYPLWLTLACEELRVFGVFREVTEKIQQLPDDLIDLEESVFERFEGQAGGDLMKACVCMLEVSRHGLLETELLALLAHKENLKEPDYSIAEQEIPTETEEGNANAAKNIRDTKEKVAKDVKETYVKEKTQKEKEIEETSRKRKRGKVIPHLPAREWAIIYRNLKPLLRPCGDLGEGRLDFYHRSLSKAARKRYFSGEEEVKQRKYNFWHGVLADYFEGVQDLDRKAEELPYHLEKLMDNNRLLQCLMDWNVFERMYNEDFSPDLLHSWQQCGGYSIATSVYKEQLAVLRNSDDMALADYAELLEKVYGFFIQAGKYPEGLERMEERLEDELERLGQRPNELADVYYEMGRCKSEILKAQQDFGDSSEDDKEIVDNCWKSIEYRKGLTNDDSAYRSGLAYIMIAHHRAEIADIDARYKDTDDEIRLAFEAIEEAEKIFRKLNDLGHIGECLMTKGTIDRYMPFEEKESILLESLDLCLKGYGERHVLLGRIYANIADTYHWHRLRDKALDYHVKKRDIDLVLLGPSHPKTQRTLNVLKSEPYASMLSQREQSVPEVA